MQPRRSQGWRCWAPPDDSCAGCCYIRADRQHLFPIILGENEKTEPEKGTGRKCQGAWPEPSSHFVLMIVLIAGGLKTTNQRDKSFKSLLVNICKEMPGKLRETSLKKQNNRCLQQLWVCLNAENQFPTCAYVSDTACRLGPLPLQHHSFCSSLISENISTVALFSADSQSTGTICVYSSLTPWPQVLTLQPSMFFSRWSLFAPILQLKPSEMHIFKYLLEFFVGGFCESLLCTGLVYSRLLFRLKWRFVKVLPPVTHVCPPDAE